MAFGGKSPNVRRNSKTVLSTKRKIKTSSSDAAEQNQQTPNGALGNPAVRLGPSADGFPNVSRSARSCSSIKAASAQICERAGWGKSEQNDASACTLASNGGGKIRQRGRGAREPGNAISKQKHGGITNSVIVERNTPFLAGPRKLKMWMKTNKTSEVAESTFNPGAKQLPSSMSLRLGGLCSPSQTDVRRGR